MMRSLDDIAAAIRRDLHEPDKLLGLAHNLERVAYDLRLIEEWMHRDEGNAQLRLSQAWKLMAQIAHHDPNFEGYKPNPLNEGLTGGRLVDAQLADMQAEREGYDPTP